MSKCRGKMKRFLSARVSIRCFSYTSRAAFNRLFPLGGLSHLSCHECSGVIWTQRLEIEGEQTPNV